jgi:hypothetical protein
MAEEKGMKDQFVQKNDEPPSSPPEGNRGACMPRCMPRHEKIRCALLCAFLLIVIASFLIFVAAQTVAPLFGSIVVVPLLYWGIDQRLSKTESP